jgi:hypothetical protein
MGVAFASTVGMRKSGLNTGRFLDPPEFTLLHDQGSEETLFDRVDYQPTTATLGAFVRRDDYNYYPGSDPFADLGLPSLQRESVGQNRTLTNAGLRSDLYLPFNLQRYALCHAACADGGTRVPLLK